MDKTPTKDSKRRLNSNVKEFTPQPKPHKQVEQSAPENSAQILIDLLLQMNLNYKYKHDFSRASEYTNIEQVKQRFMSMRSINNDESDLSAYQDASFFVMRSSSYDDIHKAMKYGIWTSTGDNNAKISEAFAKNKEEGRKVVLLFRVASENILCGAAELISDFIEEQQFDYWWSKARWKGIFNLKWIFIKNIDLKSVTRKENDKRLFELIDGEQMSSENGHFLLDMFRHIEFKHDYSIFKFFQLFDQREDYLMGVRSTMDVQIKLQKQERKLPHPVESFKSNSRKVSHVPNYYPDEERNDDMQDEGHAKGKRGSLQYDYHAPDSYSKKNKGKGERRKSAVDHKSNKVKYVYVQKDTKDKVELTDEKKNDTKIEN